MHELSVCQALLSQVTILAAARNAVAVSAVTIEVGALAGVEPQLLLNAFAIMRRGSCAADATLRVVTLNVTVECLACGLHTPTPPNRLVCASCGGFRTRIVAGDELRLRSVEMTLAERAPTPFWAPEQSSVGSN
jgi:hydrogenase nickel incorporation protein HypA/HybF